MQAVGIKTALACILFGFSSLGPGGHFQADEGVSLRRDAGGHFAAEFPVYNKYANEDLELKGSNTYTFDPKKCEGYTSLFGDTHEAVDALKELLCKEYKGKTVNALSLFEEHQKTSRYCRDHYTVALMNAVKEGLATSEFTDGKNHKVSVLIDPACIMRFN